MFQIQTKTVQDNRLCIQVQKYLANKKMANKKKLANKKNQPESVESKVRRWQRVEPRPPSQWRQAATSSPAEKFQLYFEIGGKTKPPSTKTTTTLTMDTSSSKFA